MVIGAFHEAATWMATMHWADLLQTTHWHLPLDTAVLDNPIQVDLFGDVQRAFNRFVKTGQIWAFLVGLILGYLFRSFTSYG
jgi:hypothetical protein